MWKYNVSGLRLKNREVTVDPWNILSLQTCLHSSKMWEYYVSGPINCGRPGIRERSGDRGEEVVSSFAVVRGGGKFPQKRP